MLQKIDSFRGEHRFLSNFFACYEMLYYQGINYPTAEHAYQAAKTDDKPAKQRIANLLTPGEAKRGGRKLTLRKNWEQMKLEVMYDIVQIKFHNNPGLAQALLNTGAAELVEGNTWGDTFWGTCGGVGRNELGKILMQIREELKTKEKT